MVTGIGVHTLRAWEKRYGVVNPERNSNGRRYYSDEDIEKLKNIAKLTKNGEQISVISRYSDEELTARAGKISDDIFNKEEESRLSSSIFILKKAFDLGVQDVIFHELTTLGQEVSERKFQLGQYIDKLVVPFYQYVVSADEKNIHLAGFSRTVFMLLSGNLKMVLSQAIDSYNEKEVELTFKKQPILVGSSGSIKGEIDSLICCIKSYLNGREAIYIGSQLNADIVSELIDSMPESKVILTDRYVSSKPYPEVFNLMSKFDESYLNHTELAILLHRQDNFQKTNFRLSGKVKTFESFDSLDCFFNNAC